MTIQQIIDEQMREFDKKFVVECPTGLNKGKEVLNPMFPEPIKSFLSSYTRKLIEALGEEIINAHDKCGYVHDEAGPEYDMCESCSAIFNHKVEQRLRLKEILSNIK